MSIWAHKLSILAKPAGLCDMKMYVGELQVLFKDPHEGKRPKRASCNYKLVNATNFARKGGTSLTF